MRQTMQQCRILCIFNLTKTIGLFKIYKTVAAIMLIADIQYITYSIATKI